VRPAAAEEEEYELETAAAQVETAAQVEPVVEEHPEPEVARASEPSAGRVAELEVALEKARVAEAELAREFKNYRRHAEADLAKATSKAQVQLLAELADTLQALELAGGAADRDPDAVRDGVARVARNLQKVFERHGLARIPAQGVAFDPTLHEAVLVEHVEGVVRGTVVRELSPGFRTDDEVVRPAKVSVAA